MAAIVKSILLSTAGWLLGLNIIIAPSPLMAEACSIPAAFTADETKLCDQLTLKNQPWAAVRWEVSLSEARARAERDGKPVFLVVNTGNVLGFV